MDINELAAADLVWLIDELGECIMYTTQKGDEFEIKPLLIKMLFTKPPYGFNCALLIRCFFPFLSATLKEPIMATLTIELPEILAHQIQTYGISRQGLEQMFVRLVQTYLHEYKLANDNPTASVALDGETFARQVISNNRELFEELSRL